MKIKMIGIDYSKSTVAQREIFSFTLAQAQEAMREVVSNTKVNGCVIVSTCNRTELWTSQKENSQEIDLVRIICDLKQVSSDKYRNLLIEREEMDAIRHLFETACGLKSQIWGEDQILAQIKNSIANARQAETADIVLEKLFQSAITSAKKIKTETRLTPVDVSIASRTLEIIREYFNSLSGIECLVIGNGEIGRMIAALLVDAGVAVTITKRKYKNGTSVVPDGCLAVEYEKRLEKIPHSELIVSATSSPHYTIRLREVKEFLNDHRKRIFVDLAVPRDIDPAISGLEGVILLDSDSLGCSTHLDIISDSLGLAIRIIEEHIEEFLRWDKARAFIPILNEIAISTSEKIRENLNKEIEELNLDPWQKSSIDQKLARITTKAVRNILFNIKDHIDEDQWKECFGNLDIAKK